MFYIGGTGSILRAARTKNRVFTDVLHRHGFWRGDRARKKAVLPEFRDHLFQRDCIFNSTKCGFRLTTCCRRAEGRVFDIPAQMFSKNFEAQRITVKSQG